MMDNKLRNRLLILFTTLILLVGNDSLSIVTSQMEMITSASKIEFTFTLIDELPISLNDLFFLDNFTRFEAMLDEIEAGTSFWPIRPSGTFFGHGHPEGLERMDFCPHKEHVEIRAPINGSTDSYSALDGSLDYVNGVECVMDCAIGLNIGNKCSINFGHLDIPKTIFDGLESTNNLNFTKGDLIGYTSTAVGYSILDFVYYYDYSVVIQSTDFCTPNLLGKIEVLYNFQFERAKLNGLYPRAAMINDINIHKDDELWGNWYYKTGPFDSYLIPDKHISLYDFGVLTLLNREFTTKETYWKNSIDPSQNLTDDILGIGTNARYGSTPGFKGIGDMHIRLTEGDNSSGILELRNFKHCDFGSTNTSIYSRFEILQNTTSLEGDELQIEFFSTLGEAQSGFTTNMSTYYRIIAPTLDDVEIITPPPTTTSPSPSPTEEGSLIIYPTILCVVIAITIIRKKKKSLD